MINKSQKITIYTTKTCPFCVSAKELLQKKNLPFVEVDVSTPEMREALVKRAHGRKTVPQIFIGDLHVGGFDDLSELNKSGQLDAIMNEVD